MGKMFRRNDARVAEAEEASVMKAQGLIEWIMDLRGVSNKELADRLKVSQAAISQMLGLSPKNLSVKKLARVLNALDDKLIITSEAREVELAAADRKRMIEFVRHFAPRKPETPTYDCGHANDDFTMDFDFRRDLRPRRSSWNVQQEVA